MSSPDAALQKLEQARALIEDTRRVVEERGSASEKELQELKKKISSLTSDIRQKDLDLQSKTRELTRTTQQLFHTTALLEASKLPIKNFIITELRSSYQSLVQAKQAHAQAPSKYTAGFVELARGSWEESREMFGRLAGVVGVRFEDLEGEVGLEGVGVEHGVDEKMDGGKGRPAVRRRGTPRESFHKSRYADRYKQPERRDSGTVVV